jgi:hypothetical protein
MQTGASGGLPGPPAAQTETAVSTLLCHSHLEHGLYCLRSFREFCAAAVHFTIHDDGSLTPHDLERLHAALDPCRIVSAGEADALASEALAPYPNCRAFRGTTRMARKLFDPSLVARKNFIQCDSDVMFFKPFRFPPPAALGSHRAVFLQDIGEFYCIRYWHLLRGLVPPVLRGINAGFFYWNQDLDLEFLEAVLGSPAVRSRWKIHHIEQFSWALLAYRANAAMWDATQMKVVTGARDLQRSLVAGHFVTPVRPLLQRLIADAQVGRVRQSAGDEEAVTLQIRAGKTLSWYRLAAWELRRQLWRWGQRL